MLEFSAMIQLKWRVYFDLIICNKKITCAVYNIKNPPMAFYQKDIK